MTIHSCKHQIHPQNLHHGSEPAYSSLLQATSFYLQYHELWNLFSQEDYQRSELIDAHWIAD
jgi:hypothetical protein